MPLDPLDLNPSINYPITRLPDDSIEAPPCLS